MLIFDNWVPAAVAYAGLGWLVTPLHHIVSIDADGTVNCSCGRPATDKDHKPGKHPRTEHGLLDATTDVKVIMAWAEQWPESNVAIVTGAGSGIYVLDIDPRHGGLQSIRDITGTDIPGPAWGTELIQKTGSGGYHLLFKHPDKPVRNRAGMRPGLDIRGDGGYIVAAPSNHESGGVYAWLNV